MGNNCVSGKIGEDGFFYAISHSLWPSRSSDMTTVKPLEYPVEFHINPPELMKIENKYTKPSEPAVIMIDVRENPKPKEPFKPNNVNRLMSTVGLQVDSILSTKTGHLKEHYTLGDQLGHGQYGKTFLCADKKTRKNYACKSIAKRKLLTEDDVDDVRREIEIMHHLSGQHPNVISIKGAYEDPVAVHVVMELCKGGELFDRIVKRGYYSEKKAAELTRTIVGVIETCHSLGVMHRDLKPENFMFVDEEEDSDMKTIDFGLSVFFKPGEILSDVVGSPYYVAPEVLCQHYGPEADVWSAGVIVYLLVCGVLPFWGESEDEIFEEVLHGDIDFSSDPWPNISESAKDLVKKMLVRDPKRRITAHQVLYHPWVQFDGVAHDKPLEMFNRIHGDVDNSGTIEYGEFIAATLDLNKIEKDDHRLFKAFSYFDKDGSGYITQDELQRACHEFGIEDSHFEDIIQEADQNDDGQIDYNEFVAMMQKGNTE